MKRSPLRRYALMPRRSPKTIADTPDFRAVYAQVDRRSEGRCEWQESARCSKRATDHHHTVKPRSSLAHHIAALIIHLCRGHHERCDWPYARGRAVIVALGNGRFLCDLVYAPDKFAAQYIASTRLGDDGRP